MAVPQALEGVGALLLAQLARQRHGAEAPLAQGPVEVAHRLAGGAEDQGAGGLEVAQHIDDRPLQLAWGHAHGAVLDVPVRLVAADGVDAHGLALVAAGERGDLAGDGGGEQQGAAGLRRGVENLLEVLAKAQVQHLVGLVEHHHAQGREVEVAPFKVVAKAARRADHDMAAGGQVALLAPGVHAAHAGGDPRLGRRIEPAELAADLHGQLAGGGDHQGQGRAGGAELRRLAQQLAGRGQAEGDSLAGPGLGRDQEVGAHGRLHHRGLNRGRLQEALGRQRAGERRMGVGKWHRSPRRLGPMRACALVGAHIAGKGPAPIGPSARPQPRAGRPGRRRTPRAHAP